MTRWAHACIPSLRDDARLDESVGLLEFGALLLGLVLATASVTYAQGAIFRCLSLHRGQLFHGPFGHRGR